jgi:hypothetical protein
MKYEVLQFLELVSNDQGAVDNSRGSGEKGRGAEPAIASRSRTKRNKKKKQ